MRMLTLILAAPLIWAQAPDPLAADPQHYHLELQNQWVRVIRERMAVNDKMPMHQHPGPGAVIVFLTDRHNRLTGPDGKSQELRNHAGDLMWAAPSTHRGENLSNAAFEALQIEPKASGSGKRAPAEPQDATVIDPKHYRVEFENEYVRAIRVNIGPHEKLAVHKHPRTGAVLVQLTDQHLRLTPAGGTPRESNYPAKLVRWVEPAGAHQDENLSDQPLQFIRLELKQAVE